MKTEQFVMAYGVEHDRLRAILPEGFTSLRPVLRINAEIIDNNKSYVEFNTAVEKGDFRGWLNIGHWDDVPFLRNGSSVVFKNDFLEISFTGVGVEGSCPAEKDNDGCLFLDGSDGNLRLREPEVITANKEFCDCELMWKFTEGDARGVSIGRTLPAHPEKAVNMYPHEDFTVKNAARIPCRQVLGAYVVRWDR